MNCRRNFDLTGHIKRLAHPYYPHALTTRHNHAQTATTDPSSVFQSAQYSIYLPECILNTARQCGYTVARSVQRGPQIRNRERATCTKENDTTARATAHGVPSQSPEAAVRGHRRDGRHDGAEAVDDVGRVLHTLGDVTRGTRRAAADVQTCAAHKADARQVQPSDPAQVEALITRRFATRGGGGEGHVVVRGTGHENVRLVTVRNLAADLHRPAPPGYADHARQGDNERFITVQCAAEYDRGGEGEGKGKSDTS